MNRYDCKIIRKIGVLSQDGEFSREVNVVSWNGRQPKLDVRTWQTREDGARTPLKGITLTDFEAATLLELLNRTLTKKESA